jgi:hypothetical protein
MNLDSEENRKFERATGMKQGVKRVKWCLILLPTALVTVLLFHLLYPWPPLWYYQNFVTAPREIPTRLARSAFLMVAGEDLPEKAEGLRAAFSGGRNPSVFVRFRTDASGIAYIKEQIAPTNAVFEPFYGTPSFHIVSSWERVLGIRIIDRRIIESGLKLEYVVLSGVSMRIYIDTEHNDVQIRASHN